METAYRLTVSEQFQRSEQNDRLDKITVDLDKLDGVRHKLQ